MADSDETGARRAVQVQFNTERVLVLGQERLRAMQAASTAIDQRIAQVAAFQLAAAALAGSLLTSEHSPKLALGIAFAATLAFVVGAMLAIVGTAGSEQQLPGLTPSWWKDSDGAPGFDQLCSDEWLAIETEKSIAFNDKQDRWRTRWLNYSLAAGLVGGILIAAAAFSRLVVPETPSHPPVAAMPPGGSDSRLPRPNVGRAASTHTVAAPQHDKEPPDGGVGAGAPRSPHERP